MHQKVLHSRKTIDDNTIGRSGRRSILNQGWKLISGRIPIALQDMQVSVAWIQKGQQPPKAHLGCGVEQGSYLGLLTRLLENRQLCMRCAGYNNRKASDYLQLCAGWRGAAWGCTVPQLGSHRVEHPAPLSVHLSVANRVQDVGCRVIMLWCHALASSRVVLPDARSVAGRRTKNTS